jgi:hypothetical protein
MRLFVCSCVISVVAVAAGGASANGGDTIAGAPEVPLGQHVVAGKTGYDFWRVRLSPGDRLTVDFGSLNGNYVGLCLYRPSVTDYTRTDSQCAGYSETAGKRELVFKATLTGAWTLEFFSGCGPNSNQCDQDVAYEMTTTVRVYTHLSLSAPTAVRAGGSATLRGQLEGAAGGNVQLQTRLHGRWAHLATVRASANGSFAYRAKFRYRGTYPERAFYAGDSGHLACKSKTVTVHVT